MRKTSEFEEFANKSRIIDSTELYDVNDREVFDKTVQDHSYLSSDGFEYNENQLKRIMVNTIRHNFSNYDGLLKQIYRVDKSINRINNTFGDTTSYYQYKNSVLDRISKQYPHLEKQCKKQKRKFDMISPR